MFLNCNMFSCPLTDLKKNMFQKVFNLFFSFMAFASSEIHVPPAYMKRGFAFVVPAPKTVTLLPVLRKTLLSTKVHVIFCPFPMFKVTTVMASALGYFCLKLSSLKAGGSKNWAWPPAFCSWPPVGTEVSVARSRSASAAEGCGASSPDPGMKTLSKFLRRTRQSGS